MAIEAGQGRFRCVVGAASGEGGCAEGCDGGWAPRPASRAATGGRTRAVSGEAEEGRGSDSRDREEEREFEGDCNTVWSWSPFV